MTETENAANGASKDRELLECEVTRLRLIVGRKAGSAMTRRQAEDGHDAHRNSQRTTSLTIPQMHKFKSLEKQPQCNTARNNDSQQNSTDLKFKAQRF